MGVWVCGCSFVKEAIAVCLVQKFGENRVRIYNNEKIELKASLSRFCIKLLL